MEQMSFGEEGDRLANEGMRLARLNAKVAQYKLDFVRAVTLIPVGFEFQADLIRKALGPPPSEGITGAMMNSCAKRRLIVFTGRMEQSGSPERHTNMNRVWRRV